jgi:hypothetical protein
VVSIGADIFNHCKKLSICTEKGSYAHFFADDMKIPVHFLDVH